MRSHRSDHNTRQIINIIWTVRATFCHPLPSSLSATALSLITVCNQQDVYWKCRHPTLRQTEASLCRPQHEIEPSSMKDEKHDNEDNFPSQFSTAQLAPSGYLPEVLLPCFFCTASAITPLHFVVALRLTRQCNYCWTQVETSPASTVNHSKPACYTTISLIQSLIPNLQVGFLYCCQHLVC